MTYNPNAAVAHSFSFPDFTFTMNVTGTVVAADVGKAVALDATAANSVKLAGANDRVFGRLESFETGGLDGLTVGAISRKFRATLPVATGLTGINAPAVGDTVVGNGAGEVKCLNNTTIKTPDQSVNTVVQVLTGFVVVEML